MSDEQPVTLSRREYLTAQAVLCGAEFFLAIEAVASTAIEHPEWDMNERKTWSQWDKEYLS